MYKFVLLTVLALSSAKLADDLVMIEESEYGRSLLNLIEANLGTEYAFQVILNVTLVLRRFALWFLLWYLICFCFGCCCGC